MPDTRYRPGLAAIDEALSKGDVEGARQAVFELDADEQRILREELGEQGLRIVYRSARRVRRGPRLGRVIVLPGIMGTQLDSVDASGDSDRIWFNAFRIVPGRVKELQLTPAGDPLPPPPTIQTRAVFQHSYLPMLIELGNRWETRPFGFDWRIDIDRSAAALAEEVKSWSNGEPVHLVAHSMGGLVARRFVQLFPDVWASMQDPEGQGRGGRLVMLGTPNRGSFAIALALSGEEKIVKVVEKIDQSHDLRQLLRILNTFPGSYQLLPSPKVDLGDDHKKLFQATSWGGLPVHQALIDKGKSFQEELHPVVDPKRLLYVAGYGQETPHRIHINVPGRFTYDMTIDGDGRVPHALGLLDGVATFWVKEKHGDLPKNPRVLAGIHDLLRHGTTAALEVRRRVLRTGGQTSGRFDPTLRERMPEEVPALVAEVSGGRRKARPTLEQEIAAARLEALALSDYLGTPPAPGLRAISATRGRREKGQSEREVPSLRVEVVWGNITEAKGDVFAVGHYQGVLPQRAELALDIAISKSARDPERRVLTEHSRRGLLRGDLGDIEFFPWKPARLVAVAGMGHPGSFGESQLRRLARNLTWAVASLPDPRTVCTVLIGSGEGNLTVPAAVGAIFHGLADALVDASIKSSVRLLRIVELHRERAREIHAAVLKLRMNDQITKRITLVVKPEVVRAKGGRVGKEESLALFLATAVAAARSSALGPRKALATLLKGLPREPGLQEQVARRLDDLAESSEVPQVRLGPADTGQKAAIPTRLSYVRERDAIRAAAITDTATVAERTLGIDIKLVDEMVLRTTDPASADVASLSDLVRRLLVPRDVVPFLAQDRPFIFEVDRSMARVHWEFLSGEDASGAPASLAKWAQVSRQLRTAYSPPPAPEARPGRARRALVIGDPGDPDKGHSLPGARREALQVAEILRSKGLDVVEMIGAPDEAGGGTEGVPPATRLDVLHRLMEGRFDILHYTGHGDFDESSPGRAGWVFKDGLLTSRELDRMDIAPRLVVANACLSARTSEVTGSNAPVGQSDADILPGLADEFFRRGVRDYIGTAWEVNDAGAVIFAEVFYNALLGSPPVSLGEAMLKARAALADSEDLYGALWAAYQHYGDPTAYIADRPPSRPASEPKPKQKAGSRTPRKGGSRSPKRARVPTIGKTRRRKSFRRGR